MKTSKKIAIVFIVLVIVLGILYYVVIRGKEAVTGLPVYPGGPKVNVPQAYAGHLSSMGITPEAYGVNAPLEDVATWYEDKMSALGWGEENKRIRPGAIAIGWKKGSDGAGVMVTTKEIGLVEEQALLPEENVLHLYRGSWDKIEPLLFPRADIDYYKGVCMSAVGDGQTLSESLDDIGKAKQLGANMITLMNHYQLGDDGRPTAEVLYDSERPNLVAMINYAHLLGLRVEIESCEIPGDFQYTGTPEDFIAGYLDSMKELAEIAEAHHVYLFGVLTEIDHATMQGMYGIIGGDWEIISSDPNWVNTINDWGQRMLNVVRERFGGKVGVGFSGIPHGHLGTMQTGSWDYLDSVHVEGFDFIEFSFYGDVYDDYVENTVVNAVETIKAHKELADNNGIETLIFGEMALGEALPSPLNSTERQQIYHEFFQATHDKVDGYFLIGAVSYIFDEDLQVVAKEWYSEKI